MRTIWNHKARFFFTFLLVVGVTYGVFVLIDFVPEQTTDTRQTETTNQTSVTASDRTPDKIIFDTLNKEVAIKNPATTDVATLDEALLGGVVRHPESADLFSDGIMFLFGHSSYLPVVHNKNFQAFNGIQDLEWGDKIRIQSSDYEYVYRVDRVYPVTATAAEITLESGAHKLTLVTCNSFGTKDDRFVVEASLVDSYPL